MSRIKRPQPFMGDLWVAQLADSPHARPVVLQRKCLRQLVDPERIDDYRESALQPTRIAWVLSVLGTSGPWVAAGSIPAFHLGFETVA